MAIATLMAILKDYGLSGLILIVLIFIILKGQFTFRYPRSLNRE